MSEDRVCESVFTDDITSISVGTNVVIEVPSSDVVLVKVGCSDASACKLVG